MRLCVLGALAIAFALVPAGARAEGPTPPGPEFDGGPPEYASAFAAKELCSRVLIAGRDPAPVMEDLRYASVLAPGFAIDTAQIDIDRERGRVTVAHPGHPPRTAQRAADDGCVILPAYSGRLHFTPRERAWRGPSRRAAWPVGERVRRGRSRIDRRALDAILRAYIARPGTRSAVVVHRGELVGERYDRGFGPFTPQRSWSTAKSLTASLAGLLVDRGRMRLDERPPLLREWDGDGRRAITLRHLLTMSSGLRQNMFEGTARSLETFTPESEHAFVYFDGFDTYADALEAPLEVAPGTRWQYRNANVLATAASMRRVLAQDGQDFSTWAQRRLLEPLGMRSTTLETDPYGQFIASGTAFTTARDLARLGLLYLQDGRWDGRRLLSRAWTRFARTPSPAAEHYGAFWWLNRDGRFPNVPRDAYYASGAFGQNVLVIPSHDLVIARMGTNPPDDDAGLDLLARQVMLVAGEGSGRPGPAGGARRDVVFVANAEGGTVSILDATTFRRIRDIDVLPDGRGPAAPEDPSQVLAQPVVEAAGGDNFAQDLDVSPDGRVLYVSRGHRGDVAAFDVASGRLLWKVPVGGFRADHMTISEDGRRLYVSAMTDNRVEVVDTRTHRITGSFAAGQWPHDNHLSHDGTLVYNGSIGNILVPPGVRALQPDAYRLTVADARTLAVRRHLRFDRGVRPFVLTGDERRMYAQLSEYHGLVEVDPRDGRVLRRLDLPVDPGVTEEDYDFEAPHHGLAMSPDGETLCAAGRASDYVALVARRSMTTAAIVDVPDAPSWSANDPAGRHCFVASTRADTVSVISYATRREVARVPVGRGPKYLVGARVPESAL